MMADTTFFKYSIQKLRNCGYYLDNDAEPVNTKLAKNIYTAVWIIYPVILFMPTEIITLILNASNLGNFVKVFCDFSNHMEGIYKIYVWFRYRKQIGYVVKSLTDNTYVYEDCEDFKPKEILMQHKIRSEKWTKCYFVSANILVVCIIAAKSYLILCQFEFSKNSDFKTFPPFGNSQTCAFVVVFFQVIGLGAWAWILVSKFSVKNVEGKR